MIDNKATAKIVIYSLLPGGEYHDSEKGKESEIFKRLNYIEYEEGTMDHYNVACNILTQDLYSNGIVNDIYTGVWGMREFITEKDCYTIHNFIMAMNLTGTENISYKKLFEHAMRLNSIKMRALIFYDGNPHEGEQISNILFDSHINYERFYDIMYNKLRVLKSATDIINKINEMGNENIEERLFFEYLIEWLEYVNEFSKLDYRYLTKIFVEEVMLYYKVNIKQDMTDYNRVNRVVLHIIKSFNEYSQQNKQDIN